ncbi:MAG TPA: hypothetical protein VJT67_10200 [Longimicrobiaceae bacterium]|nr:hypothetical protein [Longimicrobiaceae bacterium]
MAADPSGLRDPWVIPGLVLLAVLTVFAVLLYRAAPQSAAEVTSSAIVAVAPDAFTPHLSRARERIAASQRARAAGDTAGAIARLAEGEEEALAARQRANDSTQVRTATELWANVVLDRAELMLGSGSRPWYRADDTAVLNEALAAVQRARTVPLTPQTAGRAGALDEAIRRRLRPGPLELFP